MCRPTIGGDHGGSILGYLFADSRFCTGERIPQVPKHAGNAQLTYATADTLASFGFRSFSLQYRR